MVWRSGDRHASVQHCDFGGVMDYADGNEGVTGGAAGGRHPRLLDEVRRASLGSEPEAPTLSYGSWTPSVEISAEVELWCR